jgi:hypothetical protein
MVELSWSQTPSSVWWALETGTGASNLSLDNILSPPTPSKLSAASGRRKRTHQHQLTSPTIFYNSLDETDFGEREEDLEQWVSNDPSRGIIRSAWAMATANPSINFTQYHDSPLKLNLWWVLR